MATIDFVFDPNELGGAGAPMAAALTIPGDPVAGQVYRMAPYDVRYEGSGAWSAQGYDRSGNAVWVRTSGRVRAATVDPVDPKKDGPLGGLDWHALARNPLVVGGVAVAALLLVGRR